MHDEPLGLRPLDDILPPMQAARERRRALRVAVFGALIAAAVVLPGLWLGTLWDNSETAYSEVAREILLTGDAVIMHLNAVPWFIQPPLYFWFAAAFAKLLGGTTLAYRLPSALATIAGSAYIAVAVVRRAGLRAALYTTLVLSTALLQAVIGRMAIMDAFLDLAVLVTILAWFRAFAPVSRPGQRARSMIVGGVAVALGILTKGPVALAIPLLVLVPWLFWERRFKQITLPSRLAMILACLAALVITAPWFLLFAIRTGAHGLSELLLHYTVGRYTGTIEKQTGPVWYYLPVVILGIFPWSAYIFPAFRYAITNVPGENAARRSLLRLAVVWAIVPLVFFSFAQTKLPNYIALEMPALAIIIGLWFDYAMRFARKTALITTAILPMILALLLFAGTIYAHVNGFDQTAVTFFGDLAAFLLILLVGGSVSAVCYMRRNAAVGAPFGIGFGVIGAMAVVSLIAAPAAEKFKSMPRIAARIQHDRKPGDLVAIQGIGGRNSLMFYTQPPIIELDSPDVPPSTPQSDPAAIECTANRMFIVAPSKRPNPDPTYGRKRTTLAIDGRDTLFLLEGPACPNRDG